MKAISLLLFPDKWVFVWGNDLIKNLTIKRDLKE